MGQNGFLMGQNSFWWVRTVFWWVKTVFWWVRTVFDGSEPFLMGQNGFLMGLNSFLMGFDEFRVFFVFKPSLLHVPYDERPKLVWNEPGLFPENLCTRNKIRGDANDLEWKNAPLKTKCLDRYFTAWFDARMRTEGRWAACVLVRRLAVSSGTVWYVKCNQSWVGFQGPGRPFPLTPHRGDMAETHTHSHLTSVEEIPRARQKNVQLKIVDPPRVIRVDPHYHPSCSTPPSLLPLLPHTRSDPPPPTRVLWINQFLMRTRAACSINLRSVLNTAKNILPYKCAHTCPPNSK